ncbi:MAG: hypothetical protein JWQ72_3569 [Polaromonas sp.]|nr:hypothetical protein [Polaromonas sp.]
MKTKFVAATVVALATLTSAGAFAQTQNHLYGEAALVAPAAPVTSTLSRADVNAAYLQARRNGELAASSEGAFASAPATGSAVSRADVRAQAVGWAKAHQADGSNAS